VPPGFGDGPDEHTPPGRAPVRRVRLHCATCAPGARNHGLQLKKPDIKHVPAGVAALVRLGG